jgi:UDP-glucose 4-epimerase
MADLSNKIIVVTGASGFIGQHVCAHLAERGHRVRALTRNSRQFDSRVEVRNYTTLTDTDSLRRAFSAADAIVHLAGRAHVMSTERRGEQAYWDVNVQGTRAVAHAAAAEGVEQILFASSVKAVGESDFLILDDNSPPRPTDAYGRSKLEAERTFFTIAHQAGICANVMRLPLVYGPGVKGNLLRLMKAVWTGLPLPIAGVNNARTMLGVENLMKFVGRMVEMPPKTNDPFLVSDLEAVSTEELVRMIGDALARTPRILRVPAGVLHFAGHVGDAIENVGVHVFTSREVERLMGSLRISSARAWDYVGTCPPLTTIQGITRMCSWYRTTKA